MSQNQEIAFTEQRFTRNYSETNARMNSDPEIPSRLVSSYGISFELVLKHSWSIEGENIYMRLLYRDS